MIIFKLLESAESLSICTTHAPVFRAWWLCRIRSWRCFNNPSCLHCSPPHNKPNQTGDPGLSSVTRRGGRELHVSQWAMRGICRGHRSSRMEWPPSSPKHLVPNLPLCYQMWVEAHSQPEWRDKAHFPGGRTLPPQWCPFLSYSYKMVSGWPTQHAISLNRLLAALPGSPHWPLWCLLLWGSHGGGQERRWEGRFRPKEQPCAKVREARIGKQLRALSRGPSSQLPITITRGLGRCPGSRVTPD